MGLPGTVHRAAALLASGLLAGAGHAEPVQWTVAEGGNGHWYEYVDAPVTWQEARGAALSSSFAAMSGHLATITSQGEQDFLFAQFGAAAWIGGSDEDEEGVWRWMDGPEAGLLIAYAFFDPGEPNDFMGGEDYLQFGYGAGGRWNDNGGPYDPGATNGYIVEYSTPSDPPPGTVQWTVAEGGNGHWYRYVDTPVSWASARSAALASAFGDQSGYLATITSQQEQDFLFAQFAVVAWIGGTDENAEGTWRWRDGPEAGTVFWQGAPTAYANFDPVEPNDSGGGEDYLQFNYYGSGEWNDNGAPGNPDEAVGYIVEYSHFDAPVDPPPSSIVAEGTWTANGHHYVAVTYGAERALTWDEASDELAAMLPGYHLATITSQAEMDFVWSVVEQAPDPGWEWWVGAFKPLEETDPSSGWQWVTGEPFAYTAWWPGEPNNGGGIENHLTLFAGPQFNDEGTALDNVRGYVAESTSDDDADGTIDEVDNCSLDANPDQFDGDADGYGNACDADLNQSGLTTSADFMIMRAALNTADPAADLNHSGLVTTTDFNMLRSRLNTKPGPSALRP